MMRRLARVVGLSVLLLLLAGLTFIVARVIFPPQMADAFHLELKQRYLDRVARLTGGTPSGPNLVVILFDDLGYGDLGVHGSRTLQTPAIDRLAAAGIRFTDGYAASPYCSASRAGLLTGRHPTRMGFDHVLQPAGTWKDTLLRIGARNRQLPAEEITLPEVLRAAGYVNGMVGKWHLGDAAPALPNDRGFDNFFGLLYSNDQGKPQVWRNREIEERHPIDQSTLTKRYTDEALDFLEASHRRPFFLYLPHTFPHVPLAAPDEVSGRSSGGLYGAVVKELDDSVRAVVEELERLDAASDTLIVVTSDNGPWFQGSSGGLRGRKMDVFEGGMRVPFIVSWPARAAGNRVSAELVSGLDLFPTVLELTGLPLPADREIDGVSLAKLLTEGGAGPRQTILYTRVRQFQAIREGRYKYHARHGVLYGNPMDWRWGPFIPRGPWLFDLVLDPNESYDVARRHPEIADRLAAQLSARRAAWRQNPRGWREID